VVRNGADLQALRTRQARPECEFNQKRCELKKIPKNNRVVHKVRKTPAPEPRVWSYTGEIPKKKIFKKDTCKKVH
jgi:hypothetical protein